MKRSVVILAALAVAGCSHSSSEREQDLAQQVSQLQQENDDLRSKLQDAEVRAAQAEQGQAIASSRAEMRTVQPDAGDDDDTDAGSPPTQDSRQLSPAERAAQAASDAAENGPGQ